MVEARKTVAVVFSDVAGSTSLGEQLDPEAVRRVMERYFEEMHSVLERHGGTVDKFIRDAVMAAFGIPVAHEDDALRTVKAAVQMRARLTELNEELKRERGVTPALRHRHQHGRGRYGRPHWGPVLRERRCCQRCRPPRSNPRRIRRHHGMGHV
jgi:class 3 adenylate cyclase